jgi:hypothetical protein
VKVRIYERLTVQRAEDDACSFVGLIDLHPLRSA